MTKNDQIQIRTNEEIKARLANVAKELGTTMSEIIRVHMMAFIGVPLEEYTEREKIVLEYIRQKLTKLMQDRKWNL